MSREPVKPRNYDASSRRAGAAATRDRICAAAEACFLRDGYARTSVRAVAREAGVAEATMYLVFSDKPALLDAAILRATRDAESEPLATLLAVAPEEVLPRLAAGVATTMTRAAPMIALGEAAAAMDARLRPAQRRAHANLRVAFLAIAAHLASGDLLRDGLDVGAAADTIYALCGEGTYLRLTRDVGLGRDAYSAWLQATLTRLLLRDGR